MAAFCGRSMSLVPDDDGGLAPSFRERGGVSGIYPSMPPSNLEETPPYKSESHRLQKPQFGVANTNEFGTLATSACR